MKDEQNEINVQKHEFFSHISFFKLLHDDKSAALSVEES